MIPPTVVNIRHTTCDVYIGRPARLGNPFAGSKFGRPVAITLYREHIRNRPDLIAIVRTLTGKRLGCWCKPLPCHGDVLVEMWHELNNLPPPTTTLKPRQQTLDLTPHR